TPSFRGTEPAPRYLFHRACGTASPLLSRNLSRGKCHFANGCMCGKPPDEHDLECARGQGRGWATRCRRKPAELSADSSCIRSGPQPSIRFRLWNTNIQCRTTRECSWAGRAEQSDEAPQLAAGG